MAGVQRGGRREVKFERKVQGSIFFFSNFPENLTSLWYEQGTKNEDSLANG